jgi:hypothetical protein
MDYFRDPYGILALAAAKEDNDDDEELSEREDFIGELALVLQSVKAKLCGKHSDFLNLH